MGTKMNFTHLVYFVKVCEYMNISKAAKDLFVSQPAVSLAIKSLEKELSAKLFIRKNNKLIMTEQGEKLYYLSNHLVQDFNSIENAFKDSKDNNKSLRVSIPPMLGTIMLPPIMNYLNRTNNRLKIELLDSPSVLSQTELINGKADLGVFCVNYDELDSSLDGLKIGESTLFFTVGKNNPLAQVKSVSFEDLKDTPICLMKEGSLQNWLIRRKFKEAGVKPNLIMTSDQVFSLINVVKTTNCGAFIFDQMLTDKELVGIPLKDPIKLSIMIAYNKNRPLSDNAKEFISFVQRSIRF